MKRNFLMLGVLLSLLLASCQSTDETLAPPEIRYGEDVCDHCNMIINEPRFAAAFATESGDTRRFDDIGEMFLYAQETGEDVRAFWFHDFHSEAWVEAADASFVHDPDLMTPMGWGVAAFASQEDAQAYAEDAGVSLMSLAALQEQVQHGELAPQGMARHDH